MVERLSLLVRAVLISIVLATHTRTRTDPATNEELGTVPELGLAETKEAIDAAAKAFPRWSKTTAKHRHDILMKFFALMKEHEDDLAKIITLENGKRLVLVSGQPIGDPGTSTFFAPTVLADVPPTPFCTPKEHSVRSPP
ncbi:hypothetical protein VNI00_009547 [Paramarasmius palmivorus]|uniref:Aldehyde dehydrogenase domain-containing protein n=1 Tax=Paramarasmius palmivorus TaxID=297713 RepID=A0AAW0CLS6_9AGAR